MEEFVHYIQSGKRHSMINMHSDKSRCVKGCI